MLDLTNIIIALENNNSYVVQDMSKGVIKEVSSFEETSKGNYSVILSDEQSCEEDIRVGDIIFSINIVNDSWFQLITKSGTRINLTGCELFGVEPLDNNKFKIIVDDKYFEVKQGDLICDVTLNEIGEYVVNYIDDSIPNKTPEYISTLQVVMRNDNSYRIKISSAYEKQFKDIDIKFCTNLLTDSIYYNEISHVFLKNTPSSFKMQFIFSSNILIAITSTLLLSVLIRFIGVKEDLSYMKNKSIYNGNIVSVFTLLTCLFFTILYL